MMYPGVVGLKVFSSLLHSSIVLWYLSYVIKAKISTMMFLNKTVSNTTYYKLFVNAIITVTVLCEVVTMS
jgi:hypothetical protein